MTVVDIDETTVLLFALVILLVPFPLISIGTREGITALWWLGLALIVLGGVVPPITRYVFGGDEDDEGSGGGEEDSESDDGTNGETGTERDGDETDERGAATDGRPDSGSNDSESRDVGSHSSTGGIRVPDQNANFGNWASTIGTGKGAVGAHNKPVGKHSLSNPLYSL